MAATLLLPCFVTVQEGQGFLGPVVLSHLHPYHRASVGIFDVSNHRNFYFPLGIIF